MYNNTQASTIHNYADVVTSTEPQRQPQVAEAFDVLEKSVEALSMNCQQLEQRLDGILRKEPEAAGNAQREVPPTVVGVASRINNSADRIHALNNQLNSILRRLEL